MAINTINRPQHLMPLKSGDVVDIIAPASGCHTDVLTKLDQLLASWGLKSNISSDIFGEDLLCANSDEQRFSQLVSAISNSQSKAIWCLLGGYGSTRLIPFLNQLKPIPQKKFFIGFSDITALHIFLQQHWGWTTIHGPSGRQSALNIVSSESVAFLKELLMNEKNSIIYDCLRPLNKHAIASREIYGSIVGGNLSLIQASLGTDWQMDASNKIIFMEEINERAYRVDRILQHLKQAEIFQQAKAIIFGDFIGGVEVDGTCVVQQVLENFAIDSAVPVLQMSGVGHGRDNYPLILGSPVLLNIGEKCSLGL